MINKGYYIYSSSFNSYYQPNRSEYMKHYQIRDILIYGYNSDLKVFYAAGYDLNGVYNSYNLSYSDFYSGIISYKSVNWIHFLKIKDVYNFTFNLHNLKQGLCDYLNSNSTYGEKWNGFSYGLDVYPAFINDINIGHKNIFLGYYRILLEHKECMYSRIQYLLNNNYITNINILENYKEIVDDFRIIFNLAIKNEIIHTAEKISNITNRMICSIEKETKILNDLSSAL